MRLDIEQAAAYLRIPIETLRFYRAHSKGPVSYKVGRRVYYDQADLDAFLAAEKVRTAVGGVSV